ncbi:MAG TPA: FKBP-type peptidyl-prolyl cis-trans isomerase [Mucilaginibacter sp.]|jgi:hypothetical protein
MKQTLFSFLLISAIGLASCRKDRIQLSIKQYDQQQILKYIAAQGITGMQRDLTGGDTSGIYYKIINPGTQSINGTPVTPLDYPDKIAFVYTIRTLDGTFVQTDTIANHFYDFVGHIYSDHLPFGLQTAVHNLLKYPDASMRVLIPSHLAYGVSGTGSGSSTIANNKIAGNESLDYYIHAVNNFNAYDDLVIKNYMTANSLTSYVQSMKIPVPGPLEPIVYWPGKSSHVPDSATYYYKVLTPGTGTSAITESSNVTATLTGQIFNGSIFYQYNTSGGYSFDVNSLLTPVQDGLINHAKVAGAKISFLIPSSLGYGMAGSSGIPPFSCLRFTWDVLTVTP